MSSTTKFCPACSMNVNTKSWSAHTVGRKHKQKVAELKAEAAKQAKISGAEKRSFPNSDIDGISAAKRLKGAEKRSFPNNDIDGISAAKRLKVEETNGGQKNVQNLSDAKNELAFIPAGFFDNPEKDKKTEAAVNKTKEFESEYAKLMNEISAVEETVTVEEEVDVKTFNYERQLEAIDETIGYWQSLNELEKKKEAIEAAKQKEEQNSESAESDDDLELNFDGDNWRSRRIF
uniref:Zinc finger protein 830 n=1 Tax=Panagrolaimus sp. JU765 TaxID=591449 RepID=A0AC34QSX4_9BILA